MSAQSEMMPADLTEHSTQGAARTRLIDALKIVLPSVILTAIGFTIALRFNQMLQPVAITAAAAAAIGVVAGFTTRWSLQNRSGLLRHITAWSMTVSGLIVLGLISQGEIGLRMLNVARTRTDWAGLGQVIVGIASAIMALRVWQKPSVVLPEARAPATDYKIVHLPTLPRIRLPEFAFPQFHSPEFSLPHVALTLPRPRFRLPKIEAWRRMRVSRPQLRLAAEEEHRCPYCLGLVEKNDRRGVKVCPICHTWHHADCWAVTGSCQVPHLN